MKKLIEYGNADKTDKKKFAQFYIHEYEGMIERIENSVKEHILKKHVEKIFLNKK